MNFRIPLSASDGEKVAEGRMRCALEEMDIHMVDVPPSNIAFADWPTLFPLIAFLPRASSSRAESPTDDSPGQSEMGAVRQHRAPPWVDRSKRSKP